MDIGMMWFDNSKVPLDVKLLKATQYYLQKYGHKPDTCLVHKDALGNESAEFVGGLVGIQVDTMQGIMPGHLWIGCEDETKSVRKSA